MSGHLTIVDHPLVQHKLTLMRERDTSTASFRRLLREISHLLAYEITRDLPMTTRTIETPLEEMESPVLKGKKLALVSILRAGNGLLDGVLELIPSARVGFIGLYRDEATLEAGAVLLQAARRSRRAGDDRGRPDARHREFLRRRGRPDPGGGATDVRFLCLLAAPEGVARMKAAHPDVPHRDRRARPASERQGLHRARPRRRRRPDVRDEIGGARRARVDQPHWITSRATCDCRLVPVFSNTR